MFNSRRVLRLRSACRALPAGRIDVRCHSGTRSFAGGGATIGKPKGPDKLGPLLPERLVGHPRTAAALPLLGNAAYLSLAGGFLCTDVLSLRVLLVCGYTGLVAFHALHPRPLRIPFRWSAFFVVVNTGMAVMLFLDRVPPKLTEEEEGLHIDHFAPLTLKQFRALLDLGRRVTYSDGAELTHENESCHELYFILEGTADMSRKGKFTSRLGRGGFPNWMSFQRTDWDPELEVPNAYGTIHCRGEVRCIVWDRKELQDLLDSDMRQRMKNVVTESIVRRLLSTPEGANVQDYIGVISQGWADVAVRQRKIKSMLASKRPP